MLLNWLIYRPLREFHCEHEWLLLTEVESRWGRRDRDPGSYLGTTFLYRCGKCGAVRKYKV